MALTLLQIFLTVAACFGLWLFWSFQAGRDRRLSLIIGGGFVVRALGAQALFWISWLRLPIARSLQLGNGFWFFAVDGPYYFFFASNMVRGGPTYVYPSRVFVQVLAAFVAAFGSVPSVAILLNCAVYLATCAIIMRFAEIHAGTPRLVILAAVAFGPGTILWSLQPLKDTLFLFLIAAMAGVFFWWQKLWQEERSGRRPWRLAICALAMIEVAYALVGLRWYFGLIVWLASSVFFILVGLAARPRMSALLAGAGLFLLLTVSVRVGARDELPARLIDPHMIVYARHGFEHTPGATSIAPGSVLAPPATASRSPSVPVLPPRAQGGGAKIQPRAPQATQAPQATKSTQAPLAPQTPRKFRRRGPSEGQEKGLRIVASQVIAGFAAMFLPRTIAQALGLVHIGGGRGFWSFVEIDTLAFDFVVLFAIIYGARSVRRGKARITPLFVLLVLVFMMTAAPMIYTVSNFGTLFRLRQMLYLIAAIAPVTLAPRAPVPRA